MSDRKKKSLQAVAIAMPELVTEDLNGFPYQYYPLGTHVVVAPGVCGGRPTIKRRRLDVRHIMGMLRRGDTLQEIAENYQLATEAIEEVVALSQSYDYEKSYA